jgi:lipoyl(octanoyl) transferase
LIRPSALATLPWRGQEQRTAWEARAGIDEAMSDTLAPLGGPPAAWRVARAPVAYDAACAVMAERARAIAAGTEPELVWLLEHPPLYTAGTSARDEDLLPAAQLPVYRTGRGGQFTYHGPGQRVAYAMLDVKRRFGDVRAYVAALEDWIIDALSAFDVAGERRQGRVGVWVHRPEQGTDAYDKIAAIGVRLSRWVSSHGISLNVAPDLSHYQGIVPCGIRDGGVTSLADLGRTSHLEQVDRQLRAAFHRRFGATMDDVGAAVAAPAA